MISIIPLLIVTLIQIPWQWFLCTVHIEYYSVYSYALKYCTQRKCTYWVHVVRCLYKTSDAVSTKLWMKWSTNWWFCHPNWEGFLPPLRDLLDCTAKLITAAPSLSEGSGMNYHLSCTLLQSGDAVVPRHSRCLCCFKRPLDHSLE